MKLPSDQSQEIKEQQSQQNQRVRVIAPRLDGAQTELKR